MHWSVSVGMEGVFELAGLAESERPKDLSAAMPNLELTRLFCPATGLRKPRFMQPQVQKAFAQTLLK